MSDDSKMQQFLLLAKGARGKALADLVMKATCAPGLFGFAELLAVPGIQEISNGDLAPYHALLHLFAFGTWSDYKSKSNSLPALTEQQITKLKQLTVVSLALKTKIIPYTVLQHELDISSVRELEDFLITECFYNGIVEGKLDQVQRCLQVHDVIGRDVRPEEIASLESALQHWAHQAQGLLHSIETQVGFASQAADACAKQRQELSNKQQEMKKNVKAELELGANIMEDNAGIGSMADFVDTDRLGYMGGLGSPHPERERSERAGPRQAGRRRLR